MRVLAGLVIALGLIVVAASVADAKSRVPAKPHKAKAKPKGKPAGKPALKISVKAHGTTKHSAKARSARVAAVRAREPGFRRELFIDADGQSLGTPWDGRLQFATQLASGDGYHIRRPWRSFGTATTIGHVERAIAETLDAFPDSHVLAIGDISAETGGTISEHRSHQSGRDVDVGLFYLEQPAGYPASFVHADADNLDCATTFKLIEAFLATTGDDGGAQMIFLDYDVQGMLYDWALEQGVSERRLARIFQYPHGRGAPEGLVRHEPNHDNHMHVRFRCANADPACY